MGPLGCKTVTPGVRASHTWGLAESKGWSRGGVGWEMAKMGAELPDQSSHQHLYFWTNFCSHRIVELDRGTMQTAA